MMAKITSPPDGLSEGVSMGGLLLVAALGLLACSGAKSAPATASARVPAGRQAPTLPEEVGTVCGAVEHSWRAESAEIRRVDTLLAPPLSRRVVPACMVHARQAHGKGTPAGRGASAFAEGSGWVHLLGYDADGPDGNLTGHQRGGVRCTVANSWDGGDDGDSTYVPQDWFVEETTCWSEPAGIAVTDTAP
jgi:hypothetical protein